MLDSPLFVVNCSGRMGFSARTGACDDLLTPSQRVEELVDPDDSYTQTGQRGY